MLTLKSAVKKSLSVLFALILCFSAFAICEPLHTHVHAIPTTGTNTYKYGRYYSYPEGTLFLTDFRVDGASKKDDVVNWFSNNGYIRHDYDLNSGASGNYIYMGYKTTTDITQGVSMIRAVHQGGLSTTLTMTVSGVNASFSAMLNSSGNAYDVNTDAGGDYIYLYYSTAPEIGLPITAIAVDQSVDATAGFYNVTRYDNGNQISDLNAGTDTHNQYVYMHYGDYGVYTDVTTEMTALKDAITRAANIQAPYYYTTDTYNTYSTALSNANAIMSAFNNKFNAASKTKAQITAVTTALNTAIDNLATTITLNATANGGTTSTTSYVVTCGNALEVDFPAGSFSATKEGYSFIGWNLNNSASEGSLASMKVGLAGTVYAIFSIIKYNVYFMNPLNNQTVKTQSVEYGSDATAPQMPQFVQKDDDSHYVFSGWDKEFTGITENKTVVAVYDVSEHNFVLDSHRDSTCKTNGEDVYKCSDCGYEKSVSIPSDSDAHRNTLEFSGKASTCREYGYTSYVYCNDCHTIVSGREQLPLVDCTWSEWAVTEATCTTNGKRERVCTVCGKKESEVIEAAGHEYSEWEVLKNPTCDVSGRNQRVCSKCNATEIQLVNPLGHDYMDSIIAPTCVDRGYTLHTCKRSNCGYSFQDTFVDANGHTWVDVGSAIIEAGCLNDGLQHQSCSVCYATQDAVVPALGHDWTDETIITDANCEDDGTMSAICDRCGEHDDAIAIPAYGHMWNRGIITQESDCENEGNRHITCTRPTCGKEMDVSIPALGHIWEMGEITQAPTCSEPGKQAAECSRCLDTKEVDLEMLGHSYYGVVTAPGCLTEGYTDYTCEVCGDTFTGDVTAPAGHKWSYSVFQPNCTTQGFTYSRCTVCGESKKYDYVDPLGHDYVSTTVDPTCEKGGYDYHNCSRCDNHYKDNETPALGHSYSVSTIPPTCTEDGYDLEECWRCGSHFKENFVPAFGHTYVETGRVQPNGTQNGYITYVCQTCDHMTKEIIFADGRAIVYATLLDVDGNPVTEATITITNLDTGESYQITSDLNGYFTEVMPEGEYEILIDRDGYDDTVGHITVANGEVTIDIPVIEKAHCDCYCHQNNIWAKIFKIFMKIRKIFGLPVNCCADPQI